MKRIFLLASISLLIASCVSEPDSSVSDSASESIVDSGNTTEDIDTEAGTDSATDTGRLDTLEEAYALAHLWNEEKLAKDVYLALDAVQPSQILRNIATNSETQHQNQAASLLDSYNIDVLDHAEKNVQYTRDDLPAGEFFIHELQSLYDDLYSHGSVSVQAALEVGCQVEVVDVIDLSANIATLANQPDAVVVVTSLRDASYSHYWAFNDQLVQQGVVDGCCSLGVVDGIDYCQPDFPR